MIEVVDTGTGIEEDIRERIFEPFFPTKDRDTGTGLGLAVIYGIVHQNDGNLYVESDTGVGTTFRSLWPLASESLPAPEVTLPRLIQGQGEKVLLVEDDVSVRHLAERVLSGNGYSTLIAENGFDALEQVDRWHEGGSCIGQAVLTGTKNDWIENYGVFSLSEC